MIEATTWFLDRLYAELPARIHSRDTNEAGGPEWHHTFAAYVSDGERNRWQSAYRLDTESCNHPGVTKGHCATCGDTGLRSLDRVKFRHPMKRSLAILGKRPVPKGRPPLDAVLWALAAQDGNVDLAILSLANEWAFMWQYTKARRWVAHALWELRRVYVEDVPAREIRGKSESQAIAEAA